MKKLVIVLLLAACAASPLFLVAPAQAQWVRNGPVTYDIGLDSTSTIGAGSNTMMASTMDVKSTASAAPPDGRGTTGSAKCSRTYTQSFVWNSPGTSAWNTWASLLSGGADGSVTATQQYGGSASSDTSVYQGSGSCAAHGGSGNYNNQLPTGTPQVFQNQGGKSHATATFTLSAATEGYNGSGGYGQYSGTAHANLACGNPAYIN